VAAFTGLRDQHDDQVDCPAYAVLAANEFRGEAGAEPPFGVLVPGRRDPFAPRPRGW
jgi:hypothetical protein